jgi:ubiquitin carboxyl-terminal hydrolase 4/11/15
MTLSLSLDDHIDLTHTSRTVFVTVASSIVDEYKNRSGKEPVSPMSPGIQIGYQPKRETTTLLDCFKYFTKTEVLSDNDLWRCPKCKQFEKATKKIDLWLLPKVLIIQLKRFSYTSYFRDKIDLFVDCPIRNFDLSQFVLNPAEKSKAKYDLIAVSNHSGYLGGGHYTAHAKNSTDKQWHTFNDSLISEINEARIISDEAYVLIYQRQE